MGGHVVPAETGASDAEATDRGVAWGREAMIWLDEVDSTQDEAFARLAGPSTDAIAAGRDGSADVVCVAALRQRAGRGRRARRWEAGGGTLMMTLARLDPRPGDVQALGGAGVRAGGRLGQTPDGISARLLRLPLVLGVALAEAVAEAVPRPARDARGRDERWPAAAEFERRFGVHWPNDLVVGPSKLAGVLVERRRLPTASGGRWATAVGVGCNLFDAPRLDAGVGGRPPIDLRAAWSGRVARIRRAPAWSRVVECARSVPDAPIGGVVHDRATRLRDALWCAPDAPEAALALWGAHLAAAIDRAWSAWMDTVGEDFGPLARWSRWDVLRGQRVRVTTVDGEREGTAQGVDTASGALRVRDDDGVEWRVHAGDVLCCRRSEAVADPASATQVGGS